MGLNEVAEGALHKEPVHPLSPGDEWERSQCPGQCSGPSRSWLELALGATISGFICISMVELCPLGDASHLLWLGGWKGMGISPGLAPKPGLKPCLVCQHCEVSQDLLSELSFLLDGAWLGGQLGFTHLCLLGGTNRS